MSLHTIMNVSINALLTSYFLGKFGMIGAAYAPVIAWAVTLFVSIVAAIKLNRRAFEYSGAGEPQYRRK